MNIIIDDIPCNLHNMADITGIEKFLEICKIYGGSTVYIPVYSKVIKGSRNREIVKVYNGKNLDDLRIKHGISNQQLKRLLENKDTI